MSAGGARDAVHGAATAVVRRGGVCLAQTLGTAALLAALAGSVACDGRGGKSAGQESFPDAPVVLISVDTLRSDHLPAYGYADTRTPAIDELRRDGILFERAYSNYPITLPSHTTIFTGQLPPEHGIRDNVGYRFDAAKHPYLPAQLRQRGYATGASVSTWLLRGDTGLGTGFDFYDDAVDLAPGVSLGESQRSGTITVDHALEWLRGQRGKKFFLFLHLYEPHTPYSPPEPYRSRTKNPYDGEIEAADALVGRVLDALREQGDYDRAIVVLVSDHGEGLGEHGEREHGILLYREALQVPLVVKLPGAARAGASVAAPAQLADVAPTLLALTGERPAGHTTLLDLMAEAPPQRDLYAETYYPRIHYGWSDLASLVRGNLHYIDGPAPELYDLETDHGERTNVLEQRRRDFASLRQAIEPLRKELVAPSAVDEETTRRLASLGYLGKAVTTGSGPLPDPKAKIHLLADVDAAARAAREKRLDEAIALYRRVVDENPAMVDAWEGLAGLLGQVGRFDEAVEAFGKAMELSGGTDHVAMGLARLYLDAGKRDEARQHAELALPTNPGAAHQLLADIALSGGDLDTAEKEAKAALAARSADIQAYLLLSQVAIKRDRLEEARDYVARAEAEQARRPAEDAVIGFYLTKGDLLARQGDDAGAVSALQREIQLHPSDPRAYSRLAVVHALAGRPDLAVTTLRQLVETNQNPAAYGAAVEALRVLGDPASAARLLQVARGRFPDDPRLGELAARG